jgi:CSLREA domain-containing protein
MLEDRRVLATYVVSSTADAGEGSLREAIDLANGTVGVADEIVFNEALFSTPQAILLNSQLPTITDALAIVGPGADLLALDGQFGADGNPVFADGWRLLINNVSGIDGTFGVSIAQVTIRNFNGSSAIVNVGSLLLDSVVVADNRIGGNYGAVENRGYMRVVDSTFENNSASAGAAIYDRGAKLEVVGSRFRGNASYYNGGAIYGGSSLAVEDSYFDSNVTNYSFAEGGAIYASGAVNILRSTFVRNESRTGGAVSLNQGPTLRPANIVGSTFLENQALFGGAIDTYRGFTMSHSTVLGSRIRTSGLSSGAIDAFSDHTVFIDHSIIAGTVGVNTNGSTYPTPDLYRVTDVINSLIGHDNQGLVDGENGNLVGDESSPIDPHLAPLAYNGGPTPTLAPLPGSVVTNAGDRDYVVTPGETDQRGGPYQRVAGGRIDIGAFEAQGPVTAAPGDFNGDGRFDAADYTVWRDSLGTSVAPLTAGDATGDGFVDETDRQLWVSQYGDRYVPKVEVNSLADDDDGDIYNGRTTLREAINYTNIALWADSITFDPSLSGGVINVASTLGGYYQIEAGLTIDASMVPQGITLDAGGRTTGLHINAYHVNTDNNFDVTLVGLTIQNGVGQFGGGGAVNSLMRGVLTLIDCELHDNISGRNGGYGGAIYADGSVELIDTIIDGATSGTTNSFAGGSGSAIFAVGDVTLLRSHLRNVTATSGGGAIAAVGIRTGSPSLRLDVAPSVVLVDSSITNAVGGGIVAPGTVSLTRSTVEGLSGIGIIASGNPGLHPVVGNVELIDSAVRGFGITDRGSYSYLGLPAGAGVAAYGSVSVVRSRIEDNTVTNPLETKGGGVYARGTASIVNSVIEGNSAAYGGGVYAAGLAAVGIGSLPPQTVVLSIVDSSIDGNSVTRTGAALYAKGSVVIGESSISGNAITSFWNDSSWQMIVAIDNAPTTGVYPTISITDTIISSNLGAPNPYTNSHLVSSSVVLRGLGNYPFLNATLLRTQVIDNQMNGVWAKSVVDSVISRNAGYGLRLGGELRGSTVADNRDGGVQGSGAPLIIRDSVIRGNTSTVVNFANLSAGTGGQAAAGVAAPDSRVIVERSVISDNHLNLLPTSYSSSLYVLAGGVSAMDLLVIDSTISNNTIEGLGVSGGGVGVYGTGPARFYRSTISGNRAIGAGSRGGGVFGPGAVELVQSTVSGNSSEGENAIGGGVHAKNLVALHSTVADNTAASFGGGVYATGNVALEGIILAGNVAVLEGPDFYRLGTSTLTVNYSLLSNTTGSGIEASTGNGNLLNVDPLLSPLQDNGGPTWTHALLPESPAIDAGDPTRTTVPWSTPAIGGFPGASFTGDVDQRGAGFPRLVDGGGGVLRIDMGAVEAEAPIAAAFVWTPSLISIEPTVTTNEPSLSLPESYDIALAELSDWRASLLIELGPLNALDSNDAASFELSEDLVAADRSQETIDDAVNAEFSSWAR